MVPEMARVGLTLLAIVLAIAPLLAIVLANLVSMFECLINCMERG